jgi:membrane fusion protein (multidrug efflux system)
MRVETHGMFGSLGWPVAASVAVWALAFVSGCGTDETGASKVPETPQAAPVVVERVTPRAVERAIRTIGILEPEHDVLVSAETSGRLVSVPIQLGRRVEAEAPLAMVDPTTQRLVVEEREAHLAAAQSAHEKAQADLDRKERLYRDDSISEEAYRQGRVLVKSTQAQVRAAEVALALARKALEDAQIRSPIAGEIARVAAEVGELITPGAPIATVVSMDTLVVTVGLTEAEVVRVERGDRARVEVEPYPGAVFGGTVRGVASKATEGSGLFDVEIVVSNSGERLRAGMVARVAVILDERPDQIVIPEPAILTVHGQEVVFVALDGRAQLRRVTVGERRSGGALVTSGVGAGDLVVVVGQEALRDGQPISITVR